MEKTQEQLKKKALALEKRGRIVLEAKLQSECVMWFKNTYPEYADRLFAVFNEGKDVTHKLSIGLTPGVPDLLYVNTKGFLIGFELKQKGSRHNVKHLIRQSEWMLSVLPGKAWFCDSFDEFRNYFDLASVTGLIDPRRVLEYCKKCKKKEIEWDEISDFLKG